MNATLLAHCGTNKVDRQFLEGIEMPPATDTFQPIAHSVLVNAIEESLAFRHISILRSEFGVSPDGMKMFGLLEVNQVYEGVNFAIGLRNANDKSMRLGMVAGYKVFVCDNMALSGDFNPLLAKHTKRLDIVEAVATGIDRIQRGWQPLREAIDYKRATHIEHDAAKVLIYNAFAYKFLPMSLFRQVIGEFEATEESTLWSLENNFTEAFKILHPIAQFKAAAKLPAVLDFQPA
jgi:hypothetical protein